MRKFRVLTAVVIVLAMMVLSGCNILETDNPPTLPELTLDESTLTGTVEYVNGRTCRIVITEGDSHFDAEGDGWDADIIQLTYATLDGSMSVKVGDSVTFTYRYTKDVSERNGDPHITVNEITVN